MKIKDIYNRIVEIDETRKTLVDYDNSKKIVIWSAPIIDETSEMEFYTDYSETGTISDIEERLKKWNNPVLLIYASIVKFNAKVNDPQAIIWNNIVEHVKQNEDDFFKKNGNWKKVVGLDSIKNLVSKCN